MASGAEGPSRLSRRHDRVGPSGRSPRLVVWAIVLTVPVVALAAVFVTRATNDNSSGVGTGGNTITIKNFAFSPKPLVVKAGTKITVANVDNTAHTVTADTNSLFKTGDIPGGGTVTITVTAPGTYAYHCSIHNYMTDVLKVTG